MQEQFFTVTHATPVNVIPMPDNFQMPSLDDLNQEMPEPFRMASALNSIEITNSRLQRNLGDSVYEILDILALQSRKIDMIMGFILSTQDSPEQRFHTLSFSASELTYLHTDEHHHWVPHQEMVVKLKIFLTQECSAIYCYGKVSAINLGKYGKHVTLTYQRIRPEDQELLVRSALHLQSKQLKLRAQQRHV